MTSLFLSLMVWIQAASSADSSVAKSTSILHIGDSHTVGSFGQHLNFLAKQKKLSFNIYGSCGSSPSWWLSGHSSSCGYFQQVLGEEKILTSSPHPTPKLKDLLTQHMPGLIVVELGSNLMPELINLSEKDNLDLESSSVAQELRALLSEIDKAKIPCLWVGPPHGRNKPVQQLERMYGLLTKLVSTSCLLVDSRPYTPYPKTGGDGAHFDSLGEAGKKVAKAWAQYVFEQIVEMK